MKVQLFVPCILDQLYPSAAWDVVKVLEHFGYELSYPAAQTCCGLPAFQNGHRESAREIANKFLEDFNPKLPIVCAAPSCLSMVRKFYEGFFRNTSYHNIYRQVQQQIFELSEFLYKEKKLNTPSTFSAKVAFHHNCNALNDCGIRQQSVELLSNISGIELVSGDEKELCCGYSGELAAHHEALSVAMAHELLKEYEAAGAEVICSNDPGCLLHFESIQNKEGGKLRFMHLSQILAYGW